VNERFDHPEGWLATSGASVGVGAVVRGEGRRLAADTVRGAELRQSPGFRLVGRQCAEQLGQPLHLVIASPQLTSAVFHDERSSQYEFVLSPRGAPHEQYRMSVRLGGGCVR